MLGKIFREPLVHFIFLGLLLFVLYGAVSPRQADSEDRVIITQPLVNELVLERTSAAVKDALKSLMEAPAPVKGRGGGRRSRGLRLDRRLGA